MTRMAHCGGCGAPVPNEPSVPTDQRAPCEFCGSRTRAYKLVLGTTSEVGALMRVRHKVQGKTGHALEIVTGADWWRRGAQFVSKLRVIDRLKNRYREYVITRDGTVLQDTAESLDAHVGHGTAKTKLGAPFSMDS